MSVCQPCQARPYKLFQFIIFQLIVDNLPAPYLHSRHMYAFAVHFRTTKLVRRQVVNSGQIRETKEAGISYDGAGGLALSASCFSPLS